MYIDTIDCEERIEFDCDTLRDRGVIDTYCCDDCHELDVVYRVVLNGQSHIVCCMIKFELEGTTL
jgi:hypothetical protein